MYLSLMGIKTCYEANVIKRIEHWHKNRQTDQWNRIEKEVMDFMGT